MKYTRRQFCQYSSAAFGMVAGLSMAPNPVWATTELTVGAQTLTTVRDGFLKLPAAIIFGQMPEGELKPILEEYSVPSNTLEPECNVTVLKDGSNIILFDIGSGSSFVPTAGKLVEALAQINIDPEDVTHVVFTHGHPDHLWGVLDDFDDPLCPNATYLMGKTDWDYWMDPNTVNTISSERTAMAVGAKRRLEVIEDNMTFFKDGEVILPNVLARASFGHTPGHMSFQIGSGLDAAMIIGDAIGNHHVAFERPEWISGSDQDGELAAETRVKLLDQITTEKMRLIGFHLPNGGIGRSEKTENGYRFIPVE